MARVTCRCGEMLTVTTGDPDRLTCSRCGAKIRVRRSPAQRPEAAESEDGYVRFNCPCGRRLKVRADERPEAGKCPDCGRIVPVPEFDGTEATAMSPGSRGQGRSHSAHRGSGRRRSGASGSVGQPLPGRFESQPVSRCGDNDLASGTECLFARGNGPGWHFTLAEDGGWTSGLPALR